LEKRLGDWCISISDKVNKSILGDVLSIEFTNELSRLWSGSSSFPVWSLVISGVITIIIRETFIKGGGKGDTSWVIWIVGWWVSNILWDSSDHHGDGDVIVVRLIFLLISVLLEDGVEGVVSNDLSETLEGNRLDVIEIVGWGDIKGNGFDLIDWDIELLGPFSPLSGIGGFGSEHSGGSWSRFGSWLSGNNWSDNGLSNLNSNVLFLSWLFVVVLVVLLVMVLFVSVSGFVKGSFLLVFDHVGNMGFDHSFKFTISESLGTFV